jgi:hypothetical protein
LSKNHKFTSNSSHSKSNKKVSILPRLIVCQIIMKFSVCLRKFYSWKEIYCDYIQIMIFIFHRIKKNFLKRQSIKRSNFLTARCWISSHFHKILKMISWKIISGFLMALWMIKWESWMEFFMFRRNLRNILWPSNISLNVCGFLNASLINQSKIKNKFKI